MQSITAHNGVPIPHFMYGTAWKKEDTSRYVQMAVQAGFRAIDTCLLYTSPSPRDRTRSRMPSSA